MIPAAGVGFKVEHFEEALAAPAAGLWFEVHAENYMVDGGPRLAMLEAVRSERPLSLHGVGLSLAGAAPPDPGHLAGLKRLVDRYQPELVSEHLAWSRLDGRCFSRPLAVSALHRGIAADRPQHRRRADRAGADDPDREPVALPRALPTPGRRT